MKDEKSNIEVGDRVQIKDNIFGFTPKGKVIKKHRNSVKIRFDEAEWQVGNKQPTNERWFDIDDINEAREND